MADKISGSQCGREKFLESKMTIIKPFKSSGAG
jgi:hypothetical protein